MRNSIQLFVFVLLSLILFIQCDDDENGYKTPDFVIDFHTCIDITVDTVTTTNRLFGTWDWKFQDCTWEEVTLENEIRRQGLSIEFLENGFYSRKFNGTEIKVGTWVIDGNELISDPLVPELHGTISFCENIVKFNDTPTDGCANYFEKQE